MANNTIQLDRLDSVPLQADNFSFEFKAWVAILVDSLNTTIETIENEFNTPVQNIAPSYTTAQIAALALTAPNGSLWYDTTANHLVALINGVVTTVV
jgi:hypothetical protein